MTDIILMEEDFWLNGHYLVSTDQEREEITEEVTGIEISQETLENQEEIDLRIKNVINVEKQVTFRRIVETIEDEEITERRNQFQEEDTMKKRVSIDEETTGMTTEEESTKKKVSMRAEEDHL